MKALNNRDVNLQLDSETGVVHLSHLLPDTSVYLYNIEGCVQLKAKSNLPKLSFALPGRGIYVLVLMHSNCPLEVKRIMY